MTPTSKIEQLEEELRSVTDRIDAAYQAFVFQARAKPPSLVVPEAYARRSEIQAELRQLRRHQSLARASIAEAAADLAAHSLETLERHHGFEAFSDPDLYDEP